MPRPRGRLTFTHYSLFLQAVRLLRVSAELQGRANSLRREAVQCLTIALAGSDTKELWNLLTTYFGSAADSDDEDPWNFLDPAPPISKPLDLGETDTEDEEGPTGATGGSSAASATGAGPSTSSAVPPASSTSKSGGKTSKSSAGSKKASAAEAPAPRKVKTKPKRADALPDLCAIEKAARMYPADEETSTQTGIPVFLQVPREGYTTAAGGSIYFCRHEKCSNPPYHGDLAGVYSHVRRKHIGLALVCPYCNDKLFWNSKGWKRHMRTIHPKAVWYGTELRDEAEEAAQVLAQVEADPSFLSSQAKKQEEAFKQESEEQLKVKLDIPSIHPRDDTSDTSSDSSSSAGDTTDEDDQATNPQQTKGADPKAAKESDLTPAEKQAVREGADILVARPTEASLAKYPFARFQPPAQVIASRSGPPPAALAAAELVSSTLGTFPGDEPPQKEEADEESEERPTKRKRDA